MKSFIVFLSMIFIFFTNGFGYQDWIYQHPLPQGNSLNDIHIFDEMHAIAAGCGGTIMMTRDGGVTWDVKHGVANQNKTIFDFEFTNRYLGYAAAAQGMVLKTENGGEDWRAIQLDTDADLMGISFIDDRTGWVVGDFGAIFKTADGGKTWKSQSESMYGYFSTVCFINEKVGWVAGYNNSLYKTTDAGETWIPQITPVSYVTYNDVFFINDSLGYLCGFSGIILKTENAGETWTQQMSRTYDPINKIYFHDEKHGWAVGGCPCSASSIILRTVDGGYNWFHSSKTSLDVVNAVAFFDCNIGYFVGTGGMIYKTINGGQKWESGIACECAAHLLGVSFCNESSGCVVGQNGTIFHTDNAGKTWTAQTRVCDISGFFGDICFCDEKSGFIVTWEGKILKTNDAGINWELKTAGVPRGCSLSSVCFPDSKAGYAVGTVALKTMDNGESWIKLDQGYEYEYNRDVQFIDTATGYIVGDNGKIFKTKDGGNTWEQIYERKLMDLYACHFVDKNRGWAVGWIRYEGVIMRTLNGGETWDYQVSGTSSYLFDVFFTDARTGWIVGSSGTILHTVNAGADWEQQGGTSEVLRAVYFVDDEIGWAVGSGGTIIKTNTNYNKSETIVTLPENVVLMQCYPNPFNAATTISFSLIRPYNVTLNIYDVLGREVTTLIQDKTFVGKNEVYFDASSYSTGTYFYRIHAVGIGEYEDQDIMKVGKLLLLK